MIASFIADRHTGTYVFDAHPLLFFDFAGIMSRSNKNYGLCFSHYSCILMNVTDGHHYDSSLECSWINC